MSLSFDPQTGFPLLRLGEAQLGAGRQLDVGLLPVTKLQFEVFLATGSPDFDAAWYETVLALNRRVSAKRFDPDRREGVLLTGVQAAEAVAFARWLGDFDLPTAAEWRTADAFLRRRSFSSREEKAILGHSGLDQQAKTLLSALLQQLRPRTWGEAMLLDAGVFEWVKDDGHYRGLGGRTRPEFLHTIFNPQRHRPVEPLPAGERSKLFGFRVVRRPR